MDSKYSTWVSKAAMCLHLTYLSVFWGAMRMIGVSRSLEVHANNVIHIEREAYKPLT